MVSEVALAESDGRGDPTAPDPEPTSPPPPRLSTKRRVTSSVLLIVGLAISALSLLVLYACWHDDRDITNHLGRTDAVPDPVATIEHVVAHFEHLREVVGIEHVGIGADYDGVDETPVGLEDVSTYPALLAALAERGWSRADLTALAHGNALRVLEATEV